MERLTDKQHKAVNRCGEYSSCYSCDRAKCYISELADKLGEFEDFMEEQGFESLEELAKELRILKDYKSDWSRWHKLAFEYNEEINVDKKIIFNLKQENEKLQYRWEELKKFVNMPKEIQQWDERFEVTVDSINAKMQELELAELIRKKEK